MRWRQAIFDPLHTAGVLRQRAAAVPRNRRAIRFYGALLNKGDLSFDIGAHRGARTALFSRLGARVVAVEPQPDLAASLRSSFARDPDVTVVEAGCADRPGSMTLTLSPSAPTVATMAPHWKAGRFADMAWGPTLEVPVTTLDALIAEFGVPAFCKIDVEGFERTVLAGLSQPLPALSFEFTAEYLEHAEEALDRLAATAPIVVNCSVGESLRWWLDAWVSRDEVLDRLRSEADANSDLWGDIYVRQARAANDV